MDPKVSVIISTYYRNELLGEAIESVLDQDYEPLEIIVVDDSGEGHAEPVIQQYPRVDGIIRETEGGWEAAYTTGVEASTGDYIQFLDDDDYLLEGKLTKTAAVLQENPDVGVSYCGVIKGDEGRFHPKPEVRGDILEDALRFQTFPLWTGSMLMERSVLLDCMPLAGLADNDDLQIMLGDTDLKIELARRTNFDYVDECLAFYRRDSSTLWTDEKKLHHVEENIRHQSELYSQYPSIRRDLLASYHKKHALYWLQQRLWTTQAIKSFLMATYYSDGGFKKMKSAIGLLAALFGRPGWNTTMRLRNLVGNSQADANLIKR